MHIGHAQYRKLTEVCLTEITDWKLLPRLTDHEFLVPLISDMIYACPAVSGDSSLGGAILQKGVSSKCEKKLVTVEHEGY